MLQIIKFFLILAILSNFLIIPVVKENAEIKLALAILIEAPTTLTDEMIQTPPLVALNAIKILSMLSRAATYLLIFYYLFFY